MQNIPHALIIFTHLVAGSESTDGKIFAPSFPSTCPYVTSIGATQVSPGQSVSDPENACDQIIYSGGGFSNYFSMPDYQKTAVEGYLTSHPISYPKDVYNSTGVRFETLLSRNNVNNPSSPVHIPIFLPTEQDILLLSMVYFNLSTGHRHLRLS
jgi:hypothetical protein